MLFAVVASGLWIVNSVYSIGYMRANAEPHQTRFYVCFAVALGSTVGVAFAANLFTLFLFYEVLTLSTYPLVVHAATRRRCAAAALYILMLLGTSTVLFLPAIVAAWALAGTLDFTPGGILADGGHVVVTGCCCCALRVRHRQGSSDAVSRLAARRHGGADAGQRAAARGRGGEGGRVRHPQGRRL